MSLWCAIKRWCTCDTEFDDDDYEAERFYEDRAAASDDSGGGDLDLSLSQLNSDDVEMTVKAETTRLQHALMHDDDASSVEKTEEDRQQQHDEF